ncbi:MAG: DUF86 domain-containing protein [Acidobacteria bacterium]|nr:DUF86 domain-containing protein [Acidobacteriota bacterium]
MRRDVRMLIEDIRRSICHIQKYTHNVTFEQYEQNSLLQDGVERNFITIGEAIRRMRHVNEDAAQRIDHLLKISAFRNFLVHEYEQVSHKRVWKTAQDSLPLFKQQIDTWAAELGMPPFEENPPQKL